MKAHLPVYKWTSLLSKPPHGERDDGISGISFIRALMPFMRRGCLLSWGLRRWLSVKESTRQCRDAEDMGLIPVSWRSHARGNGNPFQYSCLEKFHGQRSLVGYSPWDCKELDMTYHAPPSWTNHLPPKHFQISHLELELSIWILRRHKTSVYNTLLPASTIHVHLTRHQLKT